MSVKDAELTNSTTCNTMHMHVEDVMSGWNHDVNLLSVSSALHGQSSPHFVNPNPGCDKECRFQHGVSMTTAMYFPPTFDKHGNNINPDGNITSSTITCGTCGKQWNSSTQYGKTTFKEVVL